MHVLLHIIVAAMPVEPLLLWLQCLAHAVLPHASHHMHHPQHQAVQHKQLPYRAVDGEGDTDLSITPYKVLQIQTWDRLQQNLNLSLFWLTNKNAAKEDEGNYTLHLCNDSGSASCLARVIVEFSEWRTVKWKQDPMITSLKNFKISNDNIRELRFLLHGPVGAGKSSTINTIKTIFEGHQFINCLAASDLSGESFTTQYQKYTTEATPFAFYDLMGIEEGQLKGAHIDDIISALKGHIPDDYKFKPQAPMCEDNKNYVRRPTLNDQIHCLVSVIAADKVTLMDNKVIQKMKIVRAEASKLGIPQLLFMTRVDSVCKMTKENVAKIYQSKKIKEKMEECSTRLGVPMNCIFPLKNYHEETMQNEKFNCLVLQAFTQAVHSANDYVKKASEGKETQILASLLIENMGSSPAKPEFVKVLADKQAKEGEDVALHCEANVGELTAKWERNGHALECVKGKHSMEQSGTTFSLIIRNAEEQDEGHYTLNLLNAAGSASCSARVIVELNEWRDVQWNQPALITALQNFKISNRNVTELRFLLVGPIGAGKSSIINTIKSIFAGHQFINCLAASDSMDFTVNYQNHTIGTLPFIFCDTMGIERHENSGVHTDDIISALKGHMPKDYKFSFAPMCADHKNYIRNPSVNDQIHCLVNVIGADIITLLDNDVIRKMKTIRAEAGKLGIPQLVFMTKVDKVCILTRKDLAKIYQSKRIKEKMKECSSRLGVPMNCIFPLKNYHEETKLNNKLNCLMLEAFMQAVYSANDYGSIPKSSVILNLLKLLNLLHFHTKPSSKCSTMGSSQSTPEFVTVLADKRVELGQNIILRCEADTEEFTATWQKNKQSLECVQDKHKIRQIGTKCILEIVNVQEEDEGFYTLKLTNYTGSVSCSAKVTVELNEWRTLQWKQGPMISKLKSFKISNYKVSELRFLLYGPVGVGKSSIINTIKSIFEGRQFINCLAAAESYKSHTIYYQKYSVAQGELFPFAFNDIMGIEKEKCEGVLTDDIISALKGHVIEDYSFSSEYPLSEGNKHYRDDPTLNDKIHCLVNVIPADKLALIKDDFIERMKVVRAIASKMGIPQVVFLTRVDRACPMTRDNLCDVYKSKKIRDIMRECSNALGVPTNCIFPVCNYNKETGMNEDINCLMLDALTQIVHWANDYVTNCANALTYVE
ncbi:hypothetical protein AOLI_G00081830 [Acnodon oligacanthus]